MYCDDDGEYRLNCLICDESSIDRSYKNHLKSQTQINEFRKRQQLNITNNSTSQKYFYFKFICKLNIKTVLLE